MNNFSEQMFQAIDILTENKISRLKYDKTVQAKIHSIVNLDTGEYKVEYNGNIFSVFASDLKAKYKVDELVYVNVPEGDFSSRKLITATVSSKSLSYSELVALQNSIFDSSPDLSTMYDYNRELLYGVVAGLESDQPNGYRYIYQGASEYNPNDFHGLFQQYGALYEAIRISATFTTQFYSQHTQGTYGLELTFYTDEGDATFKFDSSTFNGDPWRFQVGSPQSTIIQVPKGYLLGLKSIKLFQENFVPDEYPENTAHKDKYNLTTPNIFVKDISINYVEVKDLSDTSYYLTISTPRGIAFTSNISSLDLVARLVYEGQNIMDEAKCKCTWFVRDLDVMVGSPDYNKDVGFGWREIAAGDTMITLRSSDIRYSQKYKLLVVYNDTVPLTAETEIFNKLYSYEYSLSQNTDGETISLQLVNSNSLTGKWYASYQDGRYEFVGEGDSIIISDYLFQQNVTFYCAVYSASGIYIGELQYNIIASNSDADLAISYEGEDSYRYDANGDITIEDAEKERTLRASVSWREGYGSSYILQWLMNGQEIPRYRNENFSPANCMMQNLWVDNYNILHYNIKQKYKINYNNNLVTIKVVFPNGASYSYDKEILFLKDGDQGTNGTTYIAAIRPCDTNGVKLSGLQPLVYTGTRSSALNLRCYVYKDGELINNDSQYSITYKWESVNVTLNRDDSQQVTATGASRLATATRSQDLQCYVKVQIDISSNGKKVTIYTAYPIDLAIGGINYQSMDISDIPSYIKYTTSGQNPQFYNRPLKFYLNGIDCTNNIASLNTNLLTIRDRNDGRYLQPASTFMFENIDVNTQSNIGVLKLTQPNYSSRYYIRSIIMYLDNYGNEAINGWDGTALVVNEDDNHYVLAPQVGAGTKDSANRFTGVIMGQDSLQKKIGLYGYKSGVNTFGLLEDGTAFFGAKSGGGQITIDGTKATITGGGGGDSDCGMTITLANDNDNDGGSTDAIKLGNGTFKVNYRGELTATSANISGTITANSGSIGGWNIAENSISIGSGSSHVELKSSRTKGDIVFWAGSSIASRAPFTITNDGAIQATTGFIGGWKLLSNSFVKTDNTTGISNNGTYRLWVNARMGTAGDTPDFPYASYFYVDNNGTMCCSGATISGNISTSNLSADGGKIGGWIISSNSLSGGNTTLNSNGTITANALNIWVATVKQKGLNGKVYGQLGMVEGDSGNNVTENVGLETLRNDAGIILKSRSHIGIRTVSDSGAPGGGGDIYLDGKVVHIDSRGGSIIFNSHGNSITFNGININDLKTDISKLTERVAALEKKGA